MQGDGGALWQDVERVLGDPKSVLRAGERLLTLAAPYIEETCTDVYVGHGLDRELIYRIAVRRAYDSVATVLALLESPHGQGARVHVRSLADDLFFVRWLATLEEQVAAEYAQLRVVVDVLEAVVAQDRFLPIAYRQMQVPVAEVDYRRSEERLTEAKQRLARFCRSQGWGSRAPGVSGMAEAAGLTAEYKFFYFASSRSVHANLHEMGRMVWGDPDRMTMTISTDPLLQLHVDSALVHSIWLFERLIRELAPTFAPLGRLVHQDAWGVWLAFILHGMARNRRLPPLVTPEELRWHPRQAP